MENLLKQNERFCFKSFSFENLLIIIYYYYLLLLITTLSFPLGIPIAIGGDGTFTLKT